MKRIIYSSVMVIILLAACKSKPVLNEPRMLNINGIAAVGPYFTEDHKGNAVLCWSEQDKDDSLYRLKYAVYDVQKDEFGAPFTVPVSAGCSVSAESMAKVAFKDDGTVVAFFAKTFPNEKNPYAGAIYYSMSENGGESWSDAKFLHSDTSHAYGRSFFDVAKLKDGELAAVWLDGRYGKSIKGSALFFNRTLKGEGFVTDSCLDKGTCECCRTALLTDKEGNLHLAYRSIIPNALSGKHVRDMVYKRSADNGQTFTPAKVISNDNWEIDGCPHSGPALAVVNRRLQTVWFTAGGSSGLYHTMATDSGFRQRTLLTANGKHPQMKVLGDGKIAMVCEEAGAQIEEPMKMDHSKGGMMNHAATIGMSQIVLRILKDGFPEKTIALTDGKQADHHAVLTTVKHQVLLAWVREGQSSPTIHYASLKQ